MSQPQQESRNRRTTVAVDWDTLDRLNELLIAVQASEKRGRMNLGEVIAWMLDRIDAADLP